VVLLAGSLPVLFLAVGLLWISAQATTAVAHPDEAPHFQPAPLTLSPGTLILWSSPSAPPQPTRSPGTQITATVPKGGAEDEELPFWPSPSEVVTSPFGDRLDPVEGADYREHQGVDIRAPEGSVVIAADDGKVDLTTWTPRGGLLIRIAHAAGYTTSYAHLSRIEVTVGKEVRAGERIGVSGSTGRVTGPHLHFTIRRDSEPLDPVAFRYRPYALPAPQGTVPASAPLATASH
jgi:murein DD-endopeptidase MepM/ murein hydrolase activator NlpD